MARSRLSLTAPIGAHRLRIVPHGARGWSPGVPIRRARPASSTTRPRCLWDMRTGTFRRRPDACAVDPDRGRSGHRMVTLHHVSWRKSTRQHRSPTFGDIDACRLVPIRRAHPVPTGELSVNGHSHVFTPREPHPNDSRRNRVSTHQQQHCGNERLPQPVRHRRPDVQSLEKSLGIGITHPRHRHGLRNGQVHPLTNPHPIQAPQCSPKPTNPHRASSRSSEDKIIS